MLFGCMQLPRGKMHTPLEQPVSVWCCVQCCPVHCCYNHLLRLVQLLNCLVDTFSTGPAATVAAAVQTQPTICNCIEPRQSVPCQHWWCASFRLVQIILLGRRQPLNQHAAVHFQLTSCMLDSKCGLPVGFSFYFNHGLWLSLMLVGNATLCCE
jgi:hypothetical protein